MLHDPWFYAVAVPAMVLIGLSKGGFTSLNLLTVPIMALVISPVQAAAITLPILVLSDIVAVVSYWRVFDRRTLQYMLPGALAGVFLGWLTASWVTENEVRLIVGLISMLFAANYWFRHRLAVRAHGHNAATGTFWGVLTGFASFVSHAGAAPFQMYTLPLRLEPRIFAGTAVLLFAILNVVKTVPYFFLGQLDTSNLEVSLALLPLAIAATFLGVWLVKKFETETFYAIIYLMVFAVGLYLAVEALTNIF